MRICNQISFEPNASISTWMELNVLFYLLSIPRTHGSQSSIHLCRPLPARWFFIFRCRKSRIVFIEKQIGQTTQRVQGHNDNDRCQTFFKDHTKAPNDHRWSHEPMWMHWFLYKIKKICGFRMHFVAVPFSHIETARLHWATRATITTTIMIITINALASIQTGIHCFAMPTT